MSLALVIAAVVTAVLGPFVAPYGHDDQDLSRILRPPAWSEAGSWSHPLGTDALGRDLLSRLMIGTSVSLAIAGSATFAAALVGVTLGLVAGYFRGRLDDLLMRVAETQLAFPYLLLGIAVMAIVRPSIGALIAILMVRSWVVYAKVIRASTLSLREREFVTAARTVGVADLGIVFRHIAPNVASSVLVLSSFQIAELIIIESSLSFLGLGVPPPIPSWGSMLREGREYLAMAWWVGTLPGLAIVLTVLGINLLGDAVRDVLDPQLQEQRA